jgi:hypothetical protein
MLKPDQFPEPFIMAAVNYIVASGNGPAWDEYSAEEQAIVIADAREMMAAAFSAWPGAWHVNAADFEDKIIFPLGVPA